MRITDFINKSWFKVFYLTIISVYFYVFIEWVFFATKPSFMSSMNFIQTIVVYFFSSFILMVPGVLLAVFFVLVNRLHKLFNWVGASIPALIIAVLSLTLVDNFTYTVFQFGIVTSEGIWRGVYAAGLLTIFVYFLKTFAGQIQQNSTGRPSLAQYFVLLLLVTSILIIGFQIPSFRFDVKGGITSAQQVPEMPNIILLGIDGVNATNMSVYGYERDTTPNITKLAQNALIVENAFSNAGNTGGSLTSMLTGKLPTETSVIYPPDILMGEDAYQHLPGILKQLGYSTVQVTDSSYGDAYTRNIKNGFDEANFRSESTNPFLDQISRLGGGGGPYFSALMIQRVTERIGHIFYVKTMVNPYKVVTNPVSEYSEELRYDAMIDALENADGPLFLHVHMLDTHGPHFSPRQNVFSAGETQDSSWMVDFYDDAILDADTYVNDLFKYLNKTGKIKNTIAILYSDHGMAWSTLNRVPLIIWFPDDQYAGKIQENIQLIDIAPTILDYLNVSQPAWLSGQSILSNSFPATRNIFSAEPAVDVIKFGEGGWGLDETKILPPYFQLGKIDLVVCNQWYVLNLRKPGLTYGEVIGSTVDCNEGDIPSPAQAKELILQHLMDNGYDTSSYPHDISPKTDKTTGSANTEVIFTGLLICTWLRRMEWNTISR